MTLRLILIRHAKSDWSDPGRDDHARVLNARGRASADALGHWLAEKRYLPDEVLCSDAARTTETLARILPALPRQPHVGYRAALYHATPVAMLDVLRRASGRQVALVGHNPGIGSLAGALAASPPAHPRFGDYPTGAITVLDFAVESWADMTPGAGAVIDFITPRDLIPD